MPETYSFLGKKLTSKAFPVIMILSLSFHISMWFKITRMFNSWNNAST